MYCASWSIVNCWSAMRALTRSPIDTTPRRRPSSITGRWRTRARVINAMAASIECDDGHAVSGTRITLSPQLAVEPSLSWNRVTLPEGDFTTTVTGSRVTYTITPRMFVSGLVQYGSRDGSVGSNVRFRWEYEPDSELFVVYNE
jgi:hypothetical protein